MLYCVRGVSTTLFSAPSQIIIEEPVLFFCEGTSIREESNLYQLVTVVPPALRSICAFAHGIFTAVYSENKLPKNFKSR